MSGGIEIGDGAAQTEDAFINAPPMDLPANAVLNADGSVTLTLEFPKELKFRVANGDQVVRSEPVTQLVLRRLTGRDLRAQTQAKDQQVEALALSSGLGRMKIAQLLNVIDAADDRAAADVIGQLLGDLPMGLPPHAEDTPDGVRLPLWFPVTFNGKVYDELTFRRLTGAQRRKLGEQDNIVDWGVGFATGLDRRDAMELVNLMDGADGMAVNRVVLFLCGSFRTRGS